MEHIEEKPLRVRQNLLDRLRIREILEMCIDPLSTEKEGHMLVNIVSERNALPTINIDSSVQLDIQSMKKYQASICHLVWR